MKKQKNVVHKSEGTNKSKKIFIIFTSVFLGILLIFTATLGTVAIVRNARSVMKYEGVYLYSGEANYLAASYKYDFMRALTRSGVECHDDDAFWQSKSESGETYAELLKEGTERYIKRVIAGSYLFDRNTSLSKNDKAVIEQAIEDVLFYRAEGSKERFNEIAAPMGFTFSDFENAAELLYKYEMAESVIFGYDGAALTSNSFTAQCDEFFENNYSRVMLMFVHTEGKLMVDTETGKEEFIEYSDEVKEQIKAEIEQIRTLIYNAENELVAEQMNPTSFVEWYICEKYPTGTVNDKAGYYFSKTSSYPSEYEDIVELAFSTEKGHYAECEIDTGICFIYRAELEERAYSRESISHFFADFYDEAASYLYSESLDSYLPSVTVKEKYNRDSVVSIPYNSELSITFG